LKDAPVYSILFKNLFLLSRVLSEPILFCLFALVQIKPRQGIPAITALNAFKDYALLDATWK